MTCEAAAERRATSRNAAGSSPRRGGEDQTFGQRQAIEAEDEIDRELGAAAVADLADVETLREQRVEHRRGVGCDFLIAADQADAVALADLLAGARNRRFEKTQFVADARAERRDAVGIAGRGDEHDLAGGGRDERVLDHILDLIGVEHREHDRIAFVRDFGQRSGLRAELRQAFVSSPDRRRKPITVNPAATRRRA